MEVKKENTNIVQVEQKNSINPAQEVEYARKAANALMGIVKLKKKPVVINGETYLEFEDWQTIGRFYGITCGIEWTKSIRTPDDKREFVGYEAKAIVYHNGIIIGSAESMCMRNEKNWKDPEKKPIFMLRSMAQTRACAKALRNVLGFVPVLAGYKATPAEEMEK